jgi:hypothetical protein
VIELLLLGLVLVIIAVLGVGLLELLVQEPRSVQHSFSAPP